MKNWHTLSAEEVFKDLSASIAGLTDDAVLERLKQYGANQLPQQKPPTILGIFLRQFQSPLIYILFFAAGVSAAIHEVKDALFILGVLLVNALIGGYQEWRAERHSQALQKLLQIKAAVIRNGRAQDINAEDLVPGDVVLLESGNRVPADIRLLSSRSLEADESLLTGESIAVLKDAAGICAESAALGDRMNMCHAGSTIVRGRAKGMVVTTGRMTHIGRLALDVLETKKGKPPLIIRMERFSQNVAVAMLAACIVVAIVGVLAHGYTWSEMLLFAVALAVSAIPEGLPVALTVALSIATRRMAAVGVIVRRLAAVEGLGSCTLIASDKTGTLTCNELTVQRVSLGDGRFFEVNGVGYVPEGGFNGYVPPSSWSEDSAMHAFARASVLCNEGSLVRQNEQWLWRGDPTDVAFLSMALKLGLSAEDCLRKLPRVSEVPFESEKQFSASLHRENNGVSVYVKGAPEVVFSMCLDSAGQMSAWQEQAVKMARDGYRVLAVAEGDAASEETDAKFSRLRFLGLAGMMDPLREGVREAVRQCRTAGIRVIMVTGDHPQTALAIADNLGLQSGTSQGMTGAELEGRGPEELCEIVANVNVFARVTPRQKLELVQAARRAGHFIAVTGDGVNDAPALTAANIGIAMGKGGTDVAREAAALVISDDNFATIVAGIEQGRIAYDNIRKVIYLLVSTGATELLFVAGAVFAGLPLPLTAVQLLWLNLVTNGIQDVALAFEPGEKGVMKRAPRPPQEPIFNRLMLERTILAAVVMSSVCFCLYGYLIQMGWEVAAARNVLLLLMVLFENVHIGNCRSETQSALTLSPLKSPVLLIGTLTAFSLHILMMYLPVGQSLLATAPVSWTQAAGLLLLAMSVLIALEIHKWSWRIRQQKKNAQRTGPVKRRRDHS